LSSLRKLIPEAKFKSERVDPATGKRHVVLSIPSTHGRKIPVEYVVYTEEELARIKRKPREPLFPRRDRFPGVRRFPRLAGKPK
jgi:hypothetical protein